MRHLWWRDLTR